MKKTIIAVLVVFMLFVAGCSSTTKSIYDNTKSITNPDTNYNEDYSNPAKIFYPDYGIPSQYTKSMNTSVDNCMKSNNITDYKYTTTNNKLQIWVKDFENMTTTEKNKIKNELQNIYNNSVEFVKNKTDIK